MGVRSIINCKNPNTEYLSFLSSLGWLTLFASRQAILGVQWGKKEYSSTTPLLTEAKEQIIEYLRKERKTFSIPLDPMGTNFQKSVWHKIKEIPYGRTKTYGDMAKNINNAARAVGGACAKNPIPILIPCHRVVGADGKLIGFSGGRGIITKEALILLETSIKNTYD